MKVDRKALRARARRMRDDLSPEFRRQASAAIVDIVRSLPAWQAARRVMVYSPIESEVDVRPLFAEEKVVCLPRCGPHRQMDACLPCDMVRSAYGIEEPGPGADALPPEALDVVLVPCLAFDDRGYRLGYGGGYYDAFLPRLGSHAVTVLVAFSSQRVPCIPPRAGERPMDIVVTQDGWFAPADQG